MSTVNNDDNLITNAEDNPLNSTPLKRKNISTSTDCSPESFSEAEVKTKKPNKKKHKKVEKNIEKVAVTGISSSVMAEQSSKPDVSKILEKFESLSSKDDFQEFRNEMKAAMDSLAHKCDKLESDIFEVKKDNEELQKALQVEKDRNEVLSSKLVKQNARLSNTEKELNDLEQYGRRWSVRIFGVEEPDAKETVEDCTEKAVGVFRDMIGLQDITSDDIEMCHRTGSLEKAKANKKTRPIIVRFFSRQKRGLVLKNRKVLKGKRISVGEDLTIQNVKLLKRAEENSASLSAWSHNGNIFAKLKSGVVMKVDTQTNIEKTFTEHMNRRDRERRGGEGEGEMDI